MHLLVFVEGNAGVQNLEVSFQYNFLQLNLVFLNKMEDLFSPFALHSV
jgi:hypothetical protein